MHTTQASVWPWPRIRHIGFLIPSLRCSSRAEVKVVTSETKSSRATLSSIRVLMWLRQCRQAYPGIIPISCNAPRMIRLNSAAAAFRGYSRGSPCRCATLRLDNTNGQLDACHILAEAYTSASRRDLCHSALINISMTIFRFPS